MSEQVYQEYMVKIYDILLQAELEYMNQYELTHLEEEFANYEQQFPKE